MKNSITLLLAVLIAIPGIAQTKQNEDEYRLKLVIDKDGEMLNIDTSFASKAEYEAYLESLDLGEDLEIVTLDLDEEVDRKAGDENVKVIKRVEFLDGDMDSLHLMQMDNDTVEWNNEEGKKVMIFKHVEETEDEVDGEIIRKREVVVEKIIITMLSEKERTNAGVKNENEAVIQNFTVYPNPTEGELSLSFEGLEDTNGTVLVKDMNGQVILEMAIENVMGEQVIQLGALAPGVYIIELVTMDSSFARKLIVN